MKQFGSAIILAGGKSIRMGYDKQKVQIGGASMVSYISKALEALFDDIIIVTNTPKYYEKDKLCTNQRIVVDIYKEKGPLGGLHAGLLEAKSDWAYVIACDMPIINLGYIQMMKQMIKDEKLEPQKTFACVTELKGFIEPFNAFYSRAHVQSIEEGIIKEHLKLSRFIMEQNSKIINEEQARLYAKDLTMFMNLNTLLNLKECLLISGEITLPA